MGTALLVTGALGVGKTVLMGALAAALCKRAGGVVAEKMQEDALVARRTVEALR